MIAAPDTCPCGAHLYSKAELLATGNEMDRHIAEAYLDDESGYCADEDDVVPYAWIRPNRKQELMKAMEKAYWLSKVNPYKQGYMWDAFREGARAFWTGTMPEWRGNSRERAAFNKGYQAAEDAEKEKP